VTRGGEHGAPTRRAPPRSATKPADAAHRRLGHLHAPLHLAERELSYAAAYDGFLPVGSRASAEQAVRGPGFLARGGGWEKLGWRPDPGDSCAYWAEVVDGTLAAHTPCDADNNGVLAEYVSRGGRAERVTPEEVY